MKPSKPILKLCSFAIAALAGAQGLLRPPAMFDEAPEKARALELKAVNVEARVSGYAAKVSMTADLSSWNLRGLFIGDYFYVLGDSGLTIISLNDFAVVGSVKLGA